MVVNLSELHLALDKLHGHRTKRVLQAEAIEQFPCPECKAPAGERCVLHRWLPIRVYTPHKGRVICAALVNGGVTDDG